MAIPLLDAVKTDIDIVGGRDQFVAADRGPLHEQKMAPSARKAVKTLSFHQLRWRNSTTLRRAGSSWERMRSSRARE